MNSDGWISPRGRVLACFAVFVVALSILGTVCATPDPWLGWVPIACAGSLLKAARCRHAFCFLAALFVAAENYQPPQMYDEKKKNKYIPIW